MAGSRGDRVPDPLGKRALFWVPSTTEPGGDEPGAHAGTAVALGKRALYSEAPPESDSVLATSASPLAERGAFTVECQRCRQTSHVGLLDLLIFQLPVGIWMPRKRFDHRMTCPSCRRRAWCSVSLRRS